MRKSDSIYMEPTASLVKRPLVQADLNGIAYYERDFFFRVN